MIDSSRRRFNGRLNSNVGKQGERMGNSIGDQLNEKNIKERVNHGNLSKAVIGVLASKKASIRATPCRPSRRKSCGKCKELTRNEKCQVDRCSYINKSKM